MPADVVPEDCAPPAPARPWRRRARALLKLALFVYFLFGAAFLILRYGVLPDVDRWRDSISAQASAALGLPVRIGRIDADWSGLRPRFHLHGLAIADASGADALSLDQVDATLAWTSLLRFKPYFHRLEIRQPNLRLARAVDGTVSVAGIPIRGQGSDDSLMRWLLDQRQVVIRDATLSWHDALRDAPPLVLKAVNLRVVKFFGTHRVGLVARSDAPLMSAINVRAELRFGERIALDDIEGRVYAKVSHASIGAAAPWVDVPFEMDGTGDLSVWADVQGGRPVGGSLDVAAAGVRLRLADDLPALHLNTLAGHLDAHWRDGEVAVQTRALTLQTDAGLQVPPTDLAFSLRTDGGQRTGELKANHLDLAALAGLASHLPFDAAERARLAALAPRGAFDAVSLGWRSDGEALTDWSVSAGFSGVALSPRFGLPGLAGVSGHVSGDRRAGRYTVHSDGAAVDIPSVFDDALRFDRLQMEGGWAREAAGVRISLDDARFANRDLEGEASGNYVVTASGPGEIDLQAHLGKADGTAVWRYLPKVVNDDTRNWLRRGIVAGRAHDARLRLKGALSRFPFEDGSGIFLITARVDDATLDFAPGWPNIDRIDGGLRFDGPRMTISASQGRISNVRLKDVVADVPDLAHGHEQMTITGQAVGATADFLQFVADSPVSARINHFTDDMQAGGDGQLDLKLEMPLRHVADTAVTGRYRFSGNTLTLAPAIPPVAEAAGTVAFTASTLDIPKASGTALGGPVTLSAKTDADGVVRFKARGEAHASAIQARYALPALSHLSGQTPWQLDAQMRKGGSRVNIGSDLVGLASSLPAPLNKSAANALPLTVALEFPDGQPVRLSGSLGTVANAVLQLPRGAGTMSGGVGIGAPAREADTGILVACKQAQLDLDAWLHALGPVDTPEAGALPLAGVALEAQELIVKQQRLHDLQLRAQREADNWSAQIRSREAEGTLTWIPQAEGRLVARLSRLMLGKSVGEVPAPVEPAQTSMPALDITAERFGVRGLDLGQLKLQAFNRDGVWHMNELRIANPSSMLTGSGTWQASAPGRTKMDFKLSASDVGKLLTRLDYPDAVRGGKATLSGQLSWQGGPADLDYPSMNGALELVAESGQFRKLDPGVGRLLGVLSLQSLPRRITLDFRDVFSEGFAFDRISGSIDVKQGVLHTDSLQIRGPAARVFMKGTASVPDETQNLRVTVQPTLSESVAVGAALGGAVVNPVAGVVTYIVQKALEDPVEKLFAFEYAVTGTWDDPVVEKLGRRAPPAAEVPGPVGGAGKER